MLNAIPLHTPKFTAPASEPQPDLHSGINLKKKVNALLDSSFQQGCHCTIVFSPRTYSTDKTRDFFLQLNSLCQQAGVPLTPKVLSSIPKEPLWFSLLIYMYFNGVSFDGLTKEDFGLTEPGKHYAHTPEFYFKVISHIQQAGDLTIESNYLHFMKWLSKLDAIEEGLADTSLIDQLSDNHKRMQPELCNHAMREERTEKVDFGGDYYNINLTLYFVFHHEARQYLMEPFIRFASPSLLLPLFEEWSKDSEMLNWLFQQQYYPRNLCSHCYYPWLLLVHGLDRIWPEPVNAIKTAFKQTQGKQLTCGDQSVHGQELAQDYSGCFGRTLISTRPGTNSYFKVQSLQESPQAFKKTCERLLLTKRLEKELKLEDDVEQVVRVVTVHNPQALVSRQPDSQAKRFFKTKVPDDTALGLEFTTPTGVFYQDYIYDCKERTGFRKHLLLYGRQYGYIWSQGLLPPPALTAFHDIDANRGHITLAPYHGLRHTPGAMEEWKHTATNFPNIGGGGMAMRDKGDIALPEERGSDYFDQATLDLTRQDDRNKIYLEELAKTTLSFALHYGRRWGATFDHTDPASIAQIEKDIGEQIVNLFCHATPLTQDDCWQLIREENLLEQCSREIGYWLAKNIPYIKDLRTGTINRTVYPLLPEAMEASLPLDSQEKTLTDAGIIDRGREHCQLGEQSGALPLIALHAITVKLLFYGSLALCRKQRNAVRKGAMAYCSVS